jgi:hypothetical protein
VFVHVDPTDLHDAAAVAERINLYHNWERAYGTIGLYTHTPAPLAEAEATAATIRAELEARYFPQPEPAPVTQADDPLDRAAELARNNWAGGPAMLARVERALELARAGAVKDLGGGQYEVTGQSGRIYRVNGTCQCADHAHRTGWCKHRLAVALVKRAAALANNGAGDGANTPSPQPAPEGTNTHAQDTTKPAARQPLTVTLTVQYETDLARERPRTGAGKLLAFYADGQETQAPAQGLDTLYRWLQAHNYAPAGFSWLGRAVGGKRQRRQYYNRPPTAEEGQRILQALAAGD